MRPAPAILAAFAAAVALAGCSSQSNSKAADDYSGAQKDVVTVVDDLINNASKKDGKEICTTVFAKELADKLQQGAKGCADAVGDQLDDASNWDMDVVKNGVAIAEDGTATVKTTSDFCGTTEQRTITLVKQDNDWRIRRIAGTSLPPDCPPS